MILIIRVCLFYLLFIAIYNENLLAQSDEILKGCHEKRQLVKKTLDIDSSLYLALGRGEIGSGIMTTLMKKMQNLKIKQALAIVVFVLENQSIKLSLVEISYYDRYDFSNDSKIGKNEKIDKDLQDDMRIALYRESIRVIEGFKIKPPNSGTLYLQLLDDACLPIIYNTETVQISK